MMRNCNLELRLVTPSVYFNAAETFEEEDMRSQNDERQKMTIFYNGRMAACDVTEFQARAIIRLASGGEEQSSGDQASPVCESPVVTSGGLSMKRSLQRFLQKRKNRTQAMCPYTRPSQR